VIKNSSSFKKFSKYWLPVIGYVILIFCLSSISGEDIPQLFKGEDIVFHIIEYAILAILINRAFKAYFMGQSYLGRFIWVFIVSIIYAISDEFHQSFIPQRTASILDINLDGIGILIANLLYR
jgi:VanZ family protein